ncbi:MAG: hypothetical protein HY335_05560 [Deinococcus sp.]|nr:hypothetical protein [Deinococcus sp.]
MRSIPLLALTGVLGTLLTACPGPGGPVLSFTGTYIGTVGTREAAQLPEAWRAVTTLTAVLTQSGTGGITGTLTATPPGTPGPLTAMVSTPGKATGLFDPPGPDPPGTINLFLTAADQDLVIQIPASGNIAVVLERQP